MVDDRTLRIGAIVSGYYGKQSERGKNGGIMGPVNKPFARGKVIGHNRIGFPIIEVRSGNFVFRVTRTRITEVHSD